MSQTTHYLFVILAFIALNPQKTLQSNGDKETYNSRHILKVASLSNMTDFKDVLNNILIERVVGTPGHTKVHNYIIDKMKNLNWAVEEDNFENTTPFGQKNFSNIIARLNPSADKYLVLSCHYDSKYMGKLEFLGATDSAVPCAMMINLATVMSKQLDKVRESDLSLMLIFFDGEEAFVKWNSQDSLYGSKHLARKWQNTRYKDGRNELDRIDILVLLDLLGTSNPIFYSYFERTSGSFSKLVSAERKLTDLNLISYHQQCFLPYSKRFFVEDDHTPFLTRSVKILHIIPESFPEVWHTPADNMAALDFNLIGNLNKIMTVFVGDYLHLDPMV